jgi:hypothetical protein
MFTPKPGKANDTEAKAYRPISLLSFMLKIMEKLVDRHIWDEIAYQPGKSTETTLHHVITHKEKQWKIGKLHLEVPRY